MTLDQESIAIARTTVIFAVVFLLAAKIWRECGTETLRRKLQTLEVELFEFARHGHLTVGHPAYAMLRASIANLAASANQISITRVLVTAALGSGTKRSTSLAQHRREWAAALSQVSCEETRAGIVELRDRVHLEVIRHMLLGPLPFDSFIEIGTWVDAAMQRVCSQLARHAKLPAFTAKSPRRLSVPA